MDFIRRELAGITLSAAVGDEMHLITARLQRMRERLRRKNMATGSPAARRTIPLLMIVYSAGTPEPTRKKLRSCARFSGLWRVSARRKPAVTQIAIIDEPP